MVINKSLISSDLFSSSAFQEGWTANGSEVVEASATAVANPNAGNDACVPKDNTALSNKFCFRCAAVSI
jgi:hypothetical protein